MKIILDTNVLIDGFSDDFSAQARLLDAVRSDKVTALTTGPIEREYRKILRRLIADPVYTERVNEFLAKAVPVHPVSIAETIDDPDDYKFLQAAVGGGADYLVTLDQHLLQLGEIESTTICTPQECWVRLSEDSGESSGWSDFVRGWGIR